MRETRAVIYANLKGNLGDFAILHSMLSDLHRRWPECDLHVYSQPFVSVDRHRLEAFMRRAPAFEYMGTMDAGLAPPNGTLVRAARALGARKLLQEARIRRSARAATAGFGARFSGYEAIYVAGGAQWTGRNAGVSMFANLRAIAAHNPEIYTYPISVSSSLDRVTLRSSLTTDFRRIKPPLIARDAATRRALEDLGLDAVLGADCVFALAPGGDVAEAAPANRLLYVLTKQAAPDLEHAVKVARDAGFEPAFLTTCALEDEPVQRALAERLGTAFIAPATWQDAVAEMGASAMVVTNRLHGLILGSFTSTCVIPLVDREKLKAVVDDAGLPLRVRGLKALKEEDLNLPPERTHAQKAALADYRTRAGRMVWSPLET